MDESENTQITGEHIVAPTMPVTSKKIQSLQKFWAGFHNFIIVGVVFTLIGVGIGVKVSRDFYVERLEDVTKTGAMLHKTKVYTVTPKL